MPFDAEQSNASAVEGQIVSEAMYVDHPVLLSALAASDTSALLMLTFLKPQFRHCYGQCLPVYALSNHVSFYHSDLTRRFILQKSEEAQEKILCSLRTVQNFNGAEYGDEASTWQRCDAESNRPGDHSNPLQPVQMVRRIPHIYHRQNAVPVTIPDALALPQYSSWFPVRKSFALHREDIVPYRPWLGDSERDKEKAKEVCEKMLGVARADSAFDLPSDCEMDDSGCIWPAAVADALDPPDLLHVLRLRSAHRHAILEIVSRYGPGRAVWIALEKALEMPSTRHVEYAFEVARKRSLELSTKEKRLQHARNSTHSIEAAIFHPERRLSSTGSDPDVGHVLGVLKRFCFVCHVFECDVHEGVRLVPRNAIVDYGLQQRLSAIRKRETKHCSMRCFLLPRWRQSPIDSEEGKPWTDEEDQLLREGLSIFEVDPCNLSIVVGSKPCREIYRKFCASEEPEWRAHACGIPSQHSVFVEEIRQVASRMNCCDASDASFLDSDNEPVSEKGISRKKKKKKTIVSSNHPPVGSAQKTSALTEDTAEEETHGKIAFIPCDHDGPCSENINCSCDRHSRICQSSCSCNAVRYSEESGCIIRKGPECGRSQDGCDCVDGHCNSEACGCFQNQMACDPEECQCDSWVPPWEISVRDRSCRNSDIIIGRHKKTHVGRSSVEGYGLFAGDYFEEGDLVGEYMGGQWHFDLADGAIAVGDAKERPFAYDVVNVTIDGTLLGSKTKFVNCDFQDEPLNCRPQTVSVKGHFHLRLIATRRVVPGQEFLFDYGLNGIKEYDWVRNALQDLAESEAVVKNECRSYTGKPTCC